MKSFLTTRLPLVLALFGALAGCQKEDAPVADASLIGTWRLVGHQCECSPTPLANETVTFTDSTFAFHRPAPQPASAIFTNGFYRQTAVVVCGIPDPKAGLRLTDAVANIGPRDVQFAIRGNTLTLDYGSPCDAPLDTYERVLP